MTREEVLRLAECMAYKYKAASPGSAAAARRDRLRQPGGPDAGEVLRRYIIAMMPYIRTGVSLGGDTAPAMGIS